MRGWFRRKQQPATGIDIATSDRLIAAYSGYTPEQWANLPELARVNAREEIVWKLP
jgi:hypothetical protein